MNALPEVVLVTGGSGFIGGHLVASLLRKNVRVRVLTRQRSATLPPGVERVEGDLHDRSAIVRAIKGVDAVVHLAARVHVMTPDSCDEYQRVNVDAAGAILDASIAAGVRCFVLASSVKAVGERTVSGPWTEEQPPAPADAYGMSKFESERLVRAAAARAGIAAPILRFPLVYGPGVQANMLRLIRAVDRGVPMPVGRIDNRRSLLYVGNAVAAIEAVLAHPGAAKETFFVSDQDDVSSAQLVRLIARALGKPARILPVPVSLFRLGGRIGDVVARFVRFPFTSAVVDRLVGSLAVDSSKVTRVTGFRPPYSAQQGVAATVAWYRSSAARARAR